MRRGFLLGPSAGGSAGGRSSSDNGPSGVRSSSDSGPNAESSAGGGTSSRSPRGDRSSGLSEVGRPPDRTPEELQRERAKEELRERAQEQVRRMEALGLEVYVTDSGEIYSLEDLKQLVGNQ